MLVGKILQALTPFGVQKFVHSESGITIYGSVTSGGVTFFREINGDGVEEIKAANLNVDLNVPVFVTVPNGDGFDGETYVIDPLGSIVIAEIPDPDVSPLANLATGLVASDKTKIAGDARITINISGLKLGSWINVGSFKFSCTTGQLLIVSAAVTANALIYMYFTSDKGASGTDLDRILPINTNLESASVIEQAFPVDFAAFGIDPSTDVLSGQLTFEISSDAVSSLSKTPSVPLTEGELEYFKIHKR